MSDSRPTSIRTRSETRRRFAAAALAACVSLAGCGGPKTSPEEAAKPADSILTSAIARRGDSFDDREQIARLDQKRDWAGLLQFALERQKRAPNQPDWLVVAGYAWLRSGDYSKAIASLSRVTQNSPEDIDAWSLLGESQRLAAQPGRAAQTLERASTIGRTSFATFFLLGEAYRDSGRLDRAIQSYREAARIEPEFAPAWFELGSACVRLRETKEARAALERLQGLDAGMAAELSARIQAVGR
jgi:tetratricopeptide (TPR) repeat protein